MAATKLMRPHLLLNNAFRCMVGEPYLTATLHSNKIYVCCIGRAVFASCPRELMGCTENETLCVPADGGSVSFDATVTHIHGGSCGFLQNIDLIKLRKLNETTEQFKPLFICKSEYNWQCMPSSTRSRESLNLNLTRGSTGFEFTLTLFNVTTDNVGMYKVIVEKSRPSSGGTEYLKKIFHLFVGK